MRTQVDNSPAATVIALSSQAERTELRELESCLEQLLEVNSEQEAELVVKNGTTRLRVPPPALEAFLAVIGKLLAQGAVGVVGVEDELSTQDAADLLNVSRQYVVRLMNEGRLPHHRVGSHRRALVRDVLAFKRERDNKKRRQSLGKLIRLTEAYGAYEDDRA